MFVIVKQSWISTVKSINICHFIIFLNSFFVIQLGIMWNFKKIAHFCCSGIMITTKSNSARVQGQYWAVEPVSKHKIKLWYKIFPAFNIRKNMEFIFAQFFFIFSLQRSGEILKRKPCNNVSFVKILQYRMIIVYAPCKVFAGLHDV